MSSHHSQRFFNLHHQQVADGKARRQYHIQDRLNAFRDQRESIRASIRADYLCGLFFSYLAFLYMAGVSVVYLKYVINA